MEPKLPNKQDRGLLKRRVTKAGSRVTALVQSADADRDTITEALRKLQDEFKTFSDYHQLLHRTLDGLEEKLSTNYFQAMEAKYQGYIVAAEGRLSNIERGNKDPLDLEQSSSSEEEEEGHAPAGTAAIVEPDQRGVQPPANQQIEPPVLEQNFQSMMMNFMRDVNSKLAKFDEFMHSSQTSKSAAQPTQAQLQTSTPLKRHTYTPSRTHMGSLSTIMENDDVNLESLRVMRSVAESVKALAEKKETSCTQTIVREATSKLPKFKMFTFSGEAIDYLPFIRAFESQVEAKSSDAAANLGQLIDHVQDGPLKESLKFCALERDPEAGYLAAKEILKNKYGRHEDLSQAWINKIAKIKSVKSVEELSNFISTLSNCQVALRAVNQLHEFETKSNLMALVDKLPRSVKGRWQRRVVDIREEQNRGARLSDVIRLLDRLYLEKSDPIFGGTLEESSPEPRAPPRPAAYQPNVRQQRVNYLDDQSAGEQVNAFTSRQTEKKPFPYSCTCCGGQHPMYRCLTFKDMTASARIQMVKSKNACLNCFHPKHNTIDCRSQHRCHVCGGKHHTMVHVDSASNSSEQAMEERVNSIVATTLVRGKVALPVVPVSVIHVDGTMTEIYALLDQGSTSSLCTERLARRIGAEVIPHSTYITTVDRRSVKVECGKTSLKIQSKVDRKRYKLDGVLVKSTLNLSAKCKAFQDELDQWSHLKNLNLPTADVEDIDLLIGMRHGKLIFPRESLWGPQETGPFAVRTLLGWYVGGPLDDTANLTESDEDLCYAGQFSDEGTLEKDLERLWQVEGPQPKNEKSEMSPTDRSVIKKWEDNLYHDGKNYHLPIPYKDPDEHIPNNREEALQWFLSLERKLLKEEEEKQRQYVNGVMAYILQGHAEKVPEEQRKGRPGKTRYLPHHRVDHPKKPGKPRIVFNCAAKFFGKSLNDFIHSGPDLMNLLIDVLLKFRQDWIALLGDIEGMFNQILVTEEDRDVLRFFFWKDGVIGGEIEEYRMRTHLFGGIWSPSCANFTLQQVVRDFGSSFSPEAAKAVKDNFYVDDGLNADSTIDKAVKKYEELDALLARGGFNFTKIASNSKEVMAKVPREKLAKDVNIKSLEFGPNDVKAVLGCGWKPQRDTLVYPSEVPDKPSTRRGVLSTLSSVYDPLGLVAPVVVRARVVFQDTCRKKLTWDEDLTPELQTAWDAWKEGLRDMDLIEFARCILPEGVTLEDDLVFDIHVFADSSEAAYGAVGYVLVSKDDVPLGVALLMAKGRLAPLRFMSIPRLELTAAETAVMLELTLKRALDIRIRNTVFWTDSMIVIWYITNQLRRFKTFVSNKVASITANSTPVQWRHVPTELNPADLISRGTTPRELAESTLWRHGPPFLMLPESSWPPRVSETKVEENLIELKKENVVTTTVEEYLEMQPEPVVAATAEEPNITERFVSTWSSWYKTRKMLVYWKKLQAWQRLKKAGKTSDENLSDVRKEVTLREMAAAEHGILKYLQKDCRDAGGKVKQVHYKLSPIEKDGLIRVGGRLGRAEIDPARRHPVLLPSCFAVEAMIREIHLREGHACPLRVWNELRKKYWVINGKALVRKVDHTCLTCRKLKVPLCTPEMADLHEHRVQGEDKPFLHTGIDYFGPLMVKIGRSVHKRYGCIMTCLQTRAIHLELAWSLDMESCIKAILRFASRRGMPASIDSDNGTNFVSTEKEIRKAMKNWNQHKLENEFLKRGCTWSFNPPNASHMGGAWERMIRSVRSIIMTLSHEQLMSEESLITSLCIIEDILNNRPITPVSSDVRDLSALTPNNFLRLDTGVLIPTVVTDSKDAYRRRWLQVQHVSNLFWQRWRDEYLPTLQPRSKWTRTERNLREGDLVVLQDVHAPRNCWPLARVTETFPDEKGVVRVVMIRTRDGTFKRPVHKLGLLEAVR